MPTSTQAPCRYCTDGKVTDSVSRGGVPLTVDCTVCGGRRAPVPSFTARNADVPLRRGVPAPSLDSQLRNEEQRLQHLRERAAQQTNPKYAQHYARHIPSAEQRVAELKAALS